MSEAGKKYEIDGEYQSRVEKALPENRKKKEGKDIADLL